MARIQNFSRGVDHQAQFLCTFLCSLGSQAFAAGGAIKGVFFAGSAWATFCFNQFKFLRHIN
ncbi:hypothetical protein D6R50_12190 [Aeromonas veronii]|uniref:Uncharacterized protein n=1 Tax=Aeromonas veronii TaxID=654 RepID=A0A3A9J4L1_AERVE|nr:hypothetical protein D6R50_12190 [Aeromonas veronii]